MPSPKKTLQKVLSGKSDANIRFKDLRQLLMHLGFDERIRSSHHIFRKSGVIDKINLQSDGSQAKPYQVRQVRKTILKYDLGDDES